MAITNYLVHFITEATYNNKKSELRNDAVAFVKDATIIHTHGTDYYCGSGPVALKSDLSGYATTSALTSGLAGKANTSHTHTASQVSGLATVATSGRYDDLTDKPSIPSAVTVDPALSSTSTNPVQNKVINSALARKANLEHTHSAADITSGTLDISRIPTGTSASTVALGNHMHDQYLTDDDLSSYALKSEIPDISNLATKTELAGYLPLTGGTLTGGSLFLKESGAGIFYVEQAGIGIKSTNNGDDSISIMGGGVVLELTSPSHFTIDDAQILTENNWGTYITVTDTKNTTGTSNSTSKLYLVGGTSQSSTGVVTYSNTSVYTQSGQLYATRMNATSGFYETSDGTLKNIKSELNIADNIDKIPTVLFSWKKDESEDINQDVPVHVGTIAQDIQKIYPDLVAEDAEGHLTVDYAKLSVIAIAAIKELKKEIEILKSKIN